MIADLPRLADTPQPRLDGFRAQILQADREQLERTNALLREVLADVLKIAGRNAITPADDALIVRAARVLKLGHLMP